jgi:hypothetical protein
MAALSPNPVAIASKYSTGNWWAGGRSDSGTSEAADEEIREMSL